MTQEKGLRYLLNKYKQLIIDFSNRPTNERVSKIASLEEDIIKFHCGQEEVLDKWLIKTQPNLIMRANVNQ